MGEGAAGGEGDRRMISSSELVKHISDVLELINAIDETVMEILSRLSKLEMKVKRIEE